MTYQDICTALKVFGLGGYTTHDKIKKRHHELVKKYHPDTGANDTEKIRQVNAAFRVLTNYIQNYRFSFSEEDFLMQYPEERIRRQFGEDSHWGKS